LWIVSGVRRLARYADEVDAGRRTAVPALPGELGKLAKSMGAMRERLEGQRYVENTVRALTHELKSPIAAIRGAGELLREPMNDTDRVHFANNVVAQSERMHSTVERLLELSKLEQLAAPEHQQRIEVAALFARAAANAAAHAERVGVQLVFDESSTHIVGDAETLQLAIDNLVRNAIDFSPRGGVVRVTAHASHGALSIDVTDQGPGFATFVQERIGERFISTVRPDGSPKGSGLGLAIARQVALLHGGTLSVVSASEPTCMRLSLPVARPS
jgi:two-component system sensor histidine kinase CreC